MRPSEQSGGDDDAWPGYCWAINLSWVRERKAPPSDDDVAVVRLVCQMANLLSATAAGVEFWDDDIPFRTAVRFTLPDSVLISSDSYLMSTW